MGMSDYYKKIREKVGNELIFMPSVAGIVRNDLGEILLQNKGNEEKWSLPAGAIELGEAPAEAVVREVWEETGLFVMPQKLLGVFGGKDFRYQYPNGHQVEYNVFSPSNMPELALPYPKDLFIHRENSELYFQWNKQWLKNLSQK